MQEKCLAGLELFTSALSTHDTGHPLFTVGAHASSLKCNVSMTPRTTRAVTGASAEIDADEYRVQTRHSFTPKGTNMLFCTAHSMIHKEAVITSNAKLLLNVPIKVSGQSIHL